MSTPARRRGRDDLLRRALRVHDLMHLPDATLPPPRSGKPLVRSHRWRLRSFKDSFVGCDAVTWFRNRNRRQSEDAQNEDDSDVDDADVFPDRAAVTALFDDFLTVGAFQHVSKSHTFKDEKLFYRWIPRPDIVRLARAAEVRQSLVPESNTTLNELKRKLLAAHRGMVKRKLEAKARWESRQKPRHEKAISYYEKRLVALRAKLTQVEENGVLGANDNANDDLENAAHGLDAVTLALDSLSQELATLQAQQDTHKRQLYFPDIIYDVDDSDLSEKLEGEGASAADQDRTMSADGFASGNDDTHPPTMTPPSHVSSWAFRTG